MEVVSVAKRSEHSFSKDICSSIELVEGLGVRGDAHSGATVKHRSRVAIDPTQPNLRQVHLIHAELLDELNQQGFTLQAGDLGENILTRGIDLLSLPRDTILQIGDQARVQVTGLRNPCQQIENFQRGLLAAVIEVDEQRIIRRKAGVMGVVIQGGSVRPGDRICVELPTGPRSELECV